MILLLLVFFFISNKKYNNWKNYFLVFRLGDTMYFSLTFTRLLRRQETNFTKFSPLGETSVKFAPKCKSLASNNEAILTYWSLKNTFFTFCKRYSATFKLLNCLNRIFLMSCKKHLNDKFLKNELKTSKSRLFFISPEIVILITEVRIIFLVLLKLLLLLY